MGWGWRVWRREFPRHFQRASLEPNAASVPTVACLAGVLMAEERHSFIHRLHGVGLSNDAAVRDCSLPESARLAALVWLALEFQFHDCRVDKMRNPATGLLALWRNSLVVMRFFHGGLGGWQARHLNALISAIELGDYPDRAIVLLHGYFDKPVPIWWNG